MTSSHRRNGSWRRLVLGGVTAVATVLLVQSAALADPTPVPTPAVPGSPALPGPVTDIGKPADAMKTLKLTPDIAPAGKSVVLTGSGLPANKDVTIA